MFSDSEKKVINILGKRKMTITEITDSFYNGSRPKNGNNFIAMLVRRINVKCSDFKLSWHLQGVGGGRAGKTVWRKNGTLRQLRKLPIGTIGRKS